MKLLREHSMKSFSNYRKKIKIGEVIAYFAKERRESFPWHFIRIEIKQQCLRRI